MTEDVDPIEEIRRYREAHAAKFNYDLDAMFADMQERQRTSGRTILCRRPDGTEYWTRNGIEVDGPTDEERQPPPPLPDRGIDLGVVVYPSPEEIPTIRARQAAERAASEHAA
ncbi:hypothetical protein BH11PLA2_BH11PLA2_09270 [soil metagenome]